MYVCVCFNKQEKQFFQMCLNIVYFYIIYFFFIIQMLCIRMTCVMFGNLKLLLFKQ